MRIAVTGAGGRLGRALITALEESPFTGPFGPIPWGREVLDLDAPAGLEGRLAAGGIELLIHAAGMTDRAACDGDPGVALRRNGEAAGAVAAACAARGVDLVLLSCGAVFGGRPSATAHAPDDEPAPAGAFGASCLAGERAAIAAYRPAGGRRGQLGIVRTGPLFGTAGMDLPSGLLSALRPGGSTAHGVAGTAGASSAAVPPGPLASWTFAPDLAEAICELIADDSVAGIHHLVNGGAADPAAIARELADRLRLDVGSPMESVPAPSPAQGPPCHEVLAPTALPSGEPMRHWREALAGYLPALQRWHGDRARA